MQMYGFEYRDKTTGASLGRKKVIARSEQDAVWLAAAWARMRGYHWGAFERVAGDDDSIPSGPGEVLSPDEH